MKLIQNILNREKVGQKLMEVIYELMMEVIALFADHGKDSIVIIMYDTDKGESRLYRKRINGQMPLPSCRNATEVALEIAANGLLNKGEVFKLSDIDNVGNAPEEHKKAIKKTYGMTASAPTRSAVL